MCKYIISLLVVAAIMLLATPGAEARFYIDIPGTSIPAGTPFTIEVKMNNNTGDYVTGIANGFRIYSPNGAEWETPTYDTSGGLDAFFDGGVYLNGFSVDGSGADTIALGAYSSLEDGLPNGYDDVVLRITTQVSPVFYGDTLCIDSAWYPPGGAWLWVTASSGSVVPSWGGPYCFAVVPSASISGYKFLDENGNSIWEQGPDEPGLDNWEINLWDGPNLVSQTLTDINGYYYFGALSPGTYGVSESNQLGWVQTYPLTVLYTEELQWNDHVTDFDFGNCDTICEDSLRWDTCFAGTMDDFVGPEPCHWSQEMEDWITQQNHIENFDEPAVNQFFGHTIEGCWDQDCLVLEATLTIRMATSDGGCGNDVIALGEYGAFGTFWWTYLDVLCADNSWDYGDVETFTLDLADLPITGHDRTNNILAGLQDGSIDVIVYDDSKVDWVQLEVKLCCPKCAADGDANGDDITLAVADLVYLIDFIDYNGPAPVPLYSCDLTGDGYVNQDDIDLYNAYFIYGMSVFTNGYPVPCPCDPIAQPVPDTVNHFGLEHTSLGMACLEVVDDTLQVTRLGSSGEDGVSATIEETASSVSVGIANLGSIPNGGAIIITQVPPTEPLACCDYNSPYGCIYATSQECADLGGSWLKWNACMPINYPPWSRCEWQQIYFDSGWAGMYAGVGQHLELLSGGDSLEVRPVVDTLLADYTLEVYENGQLVTSVTSETGSSIATENIAPILMTVGDKTGLAWSTPIAITIPNGPTVTGDSILAIPLSKSGSSAQGEIHLRAMNIPLFSITSIEVVGCCINDRGNVDGDPEDLIDISDLVYLVDYMFTSGPPPPCWEEANVDGNGPDDNSGIDISDLVYLVDYMFNQGPAPVPCGYTPPPAKVGGQQADISFGLEYDNDVSTVVMNSPIDLRGIQLELKGTGPAPANLVGDHINMIQGRDGWVIKVGLLDLNGGEIISADTREIVRFEGKYTLEAVTVADLNARSITPTIGIALKQNELPTVYTLSQNYPNPFNPSTSISFALPEAAEVRLEVFNLVGQRVTTLLNQRLEAGNHTAEWNSQNELGQTVASGVYFYRLETPRFTESKKMVLLK